MVSRALLDYPTFLYVFSLDTRVGNNLSGQYKRGTGMALHIGIGNFSGAIASNIYRTQDKPRFILGREYILLHIFAVSDL